MRYAQIVMGPAGCGKVIYNNNNNNNESISTAQNKKILRCAGWHKKFSVSVQISEACTQKFELAAFCAMLVTCTGIVCDTYKLVILVLVLY